MKILIYKDNLSTGRGADRAVRNFAAGLEARGYAVSLMEKTAFADWLSNGDTDEPFDVVIATGSNEIVDMDRAGFFERKMRPKVILQLHLAPRGFFKWKHPIRNWCIRKAFRKADLVQVLCKSYEEEFRRIAPSANVVTIGNYTEMESGGARSSCENPEILYPAAAFTHVKNQDFLVRAFALVADDFPEWRLRLLGKNDTRYGEECRSLARRLRLEGRIDFAGYSKDLPHEYANTAFIAFPSRLEGFPLALLEAAKFGLCSVAHSDLPAACDIVSDGKTGIVTEPTVNSYAEGLCLLMGDPGLRKRMGEVARKSVLDNYSRERILDKWETLISEVAAAAHG